MDLRWVSRTALAVGVVGLGGLGAGVAAQFLSGETVLEQSVPASPPRRGKKSSSKPVVHRSDVHFDATMNPIVGTMSVTPNGSVRMRIVGPSGQVVHDQRYGDAVGPGTSSVSFVPPIDVPTEGAYRVELEVHPHLSVAVELRRNAMGVTTEWMVVTIGMAVVGFGTVILGIVARVSAAARFVSASRRVCRSDDGS